MSWSGLTKWPLADSKGGAIFRGDGYRKWSAIQGGDALWSAAGFAQAREVSLHRLVCREDGQGLAEDLCRSGVLWHGNLVVHPFALTTGRDDSRATQIGQMAGDFGLALGEDLNEVAHADFPAVHQVQKPETGAVGQGSKQQGEAVVLRGQAHTFIIYGLTDMSSGEYIRFGVCKETNP